MKAVTKASHSTIRYMQACFPPLLPNPLNQYRYELVHMLHQRGLGMRQTGNAARQPCRAAQHRRPVVAVRAEASPVATVDAAALYNDLDSQCETLRRAPLSQVSTQTSARDWISSAVARLTVGSSRGQACPGSAVHTHGIHCWHRSACNSAAECLKRTRP